MGWEHLVPFQRAQQTSAHTGLAWAETVRAERMCPRLGLHDGLRGRPDEHDHDRQGQPCFRGDELRGCVAFLEQVFELREDMCVQGLQDAGRSRWKDDDVNPSSRAMAEHRLVEVCFCSVEKQYDVQRSNWRFSPNRASMRSMQLRKMALLFHALFSRRITWFLRARCFNAAKSATRSDASFAITTCGMQACKSASSQMKAAYVMYLRVHAWGTLARGCTLPHFLFTLLTLLPQEENIQWQMLVSSTFTRRMRFASGHCLSV